MNPAQMPVGRAAKTLLNSNLRVPPGRSFLVTTD
jgi:hypothetical protein